MNVVAFKSCMYGLLTRAFFSRASLRPRFQATNLLSIFRLGRLGTQSASENSYNYATLKNGQKANSAMFLIVAVFVLQTISNGHIDSSCYTP